MLDRDHKYKANIRNVWFSKQEIGKWITNI